MFGLKKKSTKRLEWKIYNCNKTKYTGNYDINITLKFISFVIKTIDKSYSNFELYFNFKI